MPDPVFLKISPSVIFRSSVNSRERLQVDSLDLTQLHCIPKQYLENGEVFDWLRDLKSQNYIRHFGASVESMEEALICMEQEDLASLQIIFNIFRQRPIKQLFTIAREKGVALIIASSGKRSPVRKDDGTLNLTQLTIVISTAMARNST